MILLSAGRPTLSELSYSKRLKFAILNSDFTIILICLLTRAYSFTFRYVIEGPEKEWLDHLENGGTVVLCSLHQQFFPYLRYFRKISKYKPAVMISQSRDGELISRVCERMGWTAIRGSSSKGGMQALEGMKEHLKSNRLVGQIVDGPRGPAGKVKRGVVYMAQETGALIVPITARANRAHLFNSWDRFLLPKPFSTVTIEYGEMFRVDPESSTEDMEAYRDRIEEYLEPRFL